MLEKLKQAINKGIYISLVFTAISKAFDTINHDLLPATLKAYGFLASALDLICSYLKE